MGPVVRELVRRYGFVEPPDDPIPYLLGMLGDPPDLGAQAQAQINAQVAQANVQINKLQGQAKATWDASQTNVANAQRVTNGAIAAESLVQNGYNPNDDADNQKAITAVAGGLSLIPGIGPVLGGALLILDAIALGAAKLLEAIGLISPPYCNSTGNWTPAKVLAPFPSLPTTPGTFAALATAALATNAADSLNCKPHYPPSWVLTGVATLWNQNSSGNPVQIWIPNLDPSGVQIFAPQQGGGPSLDTLTSYAFQPLANVPLGYVAYGSTVTVNDGAFAPKAPPAPATGSGGGKAVAVVAVAAVAGGGLWLALGRQLSWSALKAAMRG
jgi:hypothetical protein